MSQWVGAAVPRKEDRRMLLGRGRFVADIARTEPERLRTALGVFADLELDSRGGAVLSCSRSAVAGLNEDTLALRAIEEVTAPDALSQ